jgi:uroporphyrin-III C-methyltransferase/precorrin-2 dehydrogenase/sirohydrochlorin ferrochelatase
MRSASRPPLFPAFLDLRDKPVVVVGGGEVAARKSRALERCGARITVVSPEICAGLAERVRRGAVRHRAKRFEEGDLAGAYLAAAATDDERANRAVAAAARAAGILVNVADDIEGSSFAMASVVDRGPLQVAISTAGASPALARRLRARVEGAIPEGYGALAALAGRYRATAIRRLPDPAARKRFWERVMEGPIAAHAIEGREDEAREALERALDEASAEAAQAPRK